MTVAEFAKYVQVSEQVVRNWCRRGRLPGVRKVDGVWQIDDPAAARAAWAWQADHSKSPEAVRRAAERAGRAPGARALAAPVGIPVSDAVVEYEGPGGRLTIPYKTYAALIYADEHPDQALLTQELCATLTQILIVHGDLPPGTPTPQLDAPQPVPNPPSPEIKP